MNNIKLLLLGKRIWSFFISTKLSFILFIILAVTSILGTVIPQKGDLGQYQKLYGEIGCYIVNTLKLYDIYHSPCFLLLLSLLTINLIICSLNRLPDFFKIIKKNQWDNLKYIPQPSYTFTLRGLPIENTRVAVKLLRHFIGPTISTVTNKNELIFFAQKGTWSRLSVYIVHLSILVIFTGAIVDNFLGFCGQIYLVEGEQANSYILDNGQHLPLGFSLKLNKFTISFYNNGTPSEYCSNLTFFTNNGKENKKVSLKVNDPAEYQSINFYQSSYGYQFNSLLINLIYNNKSTPLELKQNKWTKLPDGGEALVLEAYETLKLNHLYQGPAARIKYQNLDGHRLILTAFKAEATPLIYKLVKFEVMDMKTTPYTGLQIKYNPGIWLVWIGCSLMILGFLLTFYTSHRKIWIILTPVGKNYTRWELAGSANKNRFRLQHVINRLASQAQSNKF